MAQDVAQARKNLTAAETAVKAAGEEVARIQRDLTGIETALAQVEDEGAAVTLAGRRQAAQNRLRTATEREAAAGAAQQAARLAFAEAERAAKRQAHEELRARTVAALWTLRGLAVELRASDRQLQELDAEVGGYPAGQVPPNALMAELVKSIETALVRMGAADHANGLETGPILRPKGSQAPQPATPNGIKAMAAQLAAAVVGG